MWMLYVAILFHGVCFDFFFMTGQLYTDQEAPPNLRGTAQGLLAFLTYGVGMFVGSLLSGVAVDFFTTTTGSVGVRNWTGFWLASGGRALLVPPYLAFCFHSRGHGERNGTGVPPAPRLPTQTV